MKNMAYFSFDESELEIIEKDLKRRQMQHPELGIEFEIMRHGNSSKFSCYLSFNDYDDLLECFHELEAIAVISSLRTDM